jgi:Uma2 family endonuclease
MLAKTQIGVEEYLALVFPDRPEPDYVHGEVVERSMPTPAHAAIQIRLGILFAKLLDRVQLSLMSELQVQIEPGLFRVADFVVTRGPLPEGRYATEPALVVVEIVSPDDLYNNLIPRLEDYRRWGVPNVWLVDPLLKRLYAYTDAGLLRHPSLRLPEFDFEIASQELF